MEHKIRPSARGMILCSPSVPFLPLHMLSPLSLSCTCLCTCTCIHIMMLLKCSYMPQVAGFCSSYKHVWKTRLKCLALGLNWQCLYLCLLHLEARVPIPFLFLSPSQHLLLDTICSARTWHSINVCWMADFSRLPHPFHPTPTALL